MHHNGCHLTPPLASSAPSAPALGGGVHSGADAEQAWPQSSGEEDLQLQLALAMSKEEAEQVKSLSQSATGFQVAGKMYYWNGSETEEDE